MSGIQNPRFQGHSFPSGGFKGGHLPGLGAENRGGEAGVCFLAVRRVERKVGGGKYDGIGDVNRVGR